MQALCINQETLTRYAIGALDEQTATQVDGHLADCEQCLNTLDQLGSTLKSHKALLSSQPAALARAVATALQQDDDVGKLDQPPTIPGYTVLERIGQGGMGTVYKATHLRLDKTVAIKFLRRGRGQHSEAIRRFEQEMRAVGRLNHPNVVSATDAGEVNGSPYLVMEYIEGIDLNRLVCERGPLPMETAKNYIVQLANGLAAAHAVGIIHRDVKPSNAILTSDGQVKLLDLGLALLPNQETEYSGSIDINSDERVTQVGQAMGTKAYMAPEQANDAHNAGAQADVYGLGATLFFLVTGAPPTENITYPTGIDVAIWKRLLALQPAERFESVNDIAQQLTPIPKIGSIKLVSTWLVLAVVCVFTAVGLAMFLQSRGSKQDNTTPSSNLAPRMAPPPATWPFDTASAKQLQQACAEYYQVPTHYDDRLGMKYMLIPPGEFSLPPEYTTSITKPYYMAIAEVPVGHFKFFATNRNYTTQAEQAGLGGTVPIKHVRTTTDEKYTWKNPGYETSTDRHPVTQVSWNDAKAYCEFLSATSIHTHRLPTEAEWIWAAAAGNGTINFVEQDDPQKLGWYAKNSKQPQPIQQLLPNAFGLFDTFGNVSEWCHDYYGDYPQGRFENFRGPDMHLKDWHVMQGTAYFSVITQRWKRWRSNSCGAQVGFRVLRELP